MPKTSTCPDLSDYQRLVADQLPDAEQEALLEHLESCDACARKLGALPEQDALVELVRQARTEGEGPSREKIARLVERLSKMGPGEAPTVTGWWAWRSAQRTPNKMGPGETPTIAPEEKTLPPQTPPPPRALTFRCPACGKNLKVKESAAGKKVKCPHCQKAVQAPAAAQDAGEERTLPPGPANREDAGVRGEPNPKGEDGDTLAQPESRDQELTEFLAPSQAPDELGRLGMYRVLKILGAGGMGVVYKAEDPHLKRPVALKAMLPGLGASASAKKRFLREAQSAAAIKHDHIVSIYQVGEDRGAPFLAMEFLEGEPLDERLKREGQLLLPEVLRIGREMAEGLEAAHERGLIHRDIKPANVWLEGKRGRVKILDFGLARAVAEESHLTQSGAIVGTPAYMAPEQAQGKAVDSRCDLFSLGCVLYRMCSGEMPFQGTDTISTLMAVATENPRPPHERSPAVPRALSDLIMRLLAKKADERPASAREVAEELQAIAAEVGPGQERPTGTKPRQAATTGVSATAAGGPSRRSRTPLVVAGVVLLLALAAGSYFLAPIVFRVETPQGTLVVQIPDEEADNVQLVIKQGGRQVELLDLKSKKEVALNTGNYQLELVGGKEGLKLETKEVTLKRGEREIARVTFEPRPAARGGKVPLDNLRRQDIPAELLALAGAGDPKNAPPEVVVVFRDTTGNGYGAVAISPDGRWLALGVSGGPVRLIDLRTRTDSLLQGLDNSTVVGLTFSPDSLTLVRNARGKTTLWRLEEGQRWRASSADLGGDINRAAFSPDGKLLAIVRSNPKAERPFRLFQADTLREIDSPIKVTFPPLQFAFHPNGKSVLLGGWDKECQLQLVDVKSGEVLRQFTRDGKDIHMWDRDPTSVSFRPDGTLLAATLHYGGQIPLWQVSTGKLDRVLWNPKARASNVRFSPDGKSVAASSGVFLGGTIGVWDVSTGKETRRIAINSEISRDEKTGEARGEFRGFVWSPEGRHLITVNSDKTAYVLRLTPPGKGPGA